MIASANKIGFPLPYDWDPTPEDFWMLQGFLERIAEEIKEAREGGGGGGTVKSKTYTSNIPSNLEEK